MPDHGSDTQAGDSTQAEASAKAEPDHVLAEWEKNKLNSELQEEALTSHWH